MYMTDNTDPIKNNASLKLYLSKLLINTIGDKNKNNNNAITR